MPEQGVDAAMGVGFPPPEYCVLVLVDVQERLYRVMPEFETRLAVMANALETARVLEVDTIVTEQYPKGLGPTHPELLERLAAGSPVVSKTAFSCWGEPEFAVTVTACRPKALVLLGMETHVCVQQTALSALKRGYEVLLLADGVCSRCPRDRETAIELLRARGATVTTFEALAFDWLEDSTHPRFREVSRIVK